MNEEIIKLQVLYNMSIERELKSCCKFEYIMSQIRPDRANSIESIKKLSFILRRHHYLLCHTCFFSTILSHTVPHLLSRMYNYTDVIHKCSVTRVLTRQKSLKSSIFLKKMKAIEPKCMTRRLFTIFFARFSY